ncbi:MAG: DUF2752 domain-containing protein [Oscillospiraceae bacterium]|jgi:hypothetical protein|nr:DUF2752 domain-containing protein [Oscillospiraceae bacterium]
MEKSSFQKRLCRLLLFCAGAEVLILLLSRFYRCPFYAITGIPCPGCGMTRALLSALRMEWRQALHWNPMVYPLALCCGYAAVCFLMGRTRQAASIRFWGIVGVLLLAVWLLRLPSIISGDSLLFIRPGSLGDFLVSRFLC